MENAKKFYNALAKDEAMRGRANALSEKRGGDMVKADVIAFAKAEGFDLTVEELMAYANAPEEMDDNELDAVSGGAKDTVGCACAVGGGGTYQGVTCACVLGGGGKGDPGPRLKCVIAGDSVVSPFGGG